MTTLKPGELLSRFRIVEPIGAGGMGEVYRARDEKLERDVAIKVLPAQTFRDESARSRFRKEALALARLSHPYIGQVYDFANESGSDFLVMELVRGESLAARIAHGPIPPTDALRIGSQLASALEAAHGANIIHRDLKPGNLMLTEQGDLKVLDFGLAKLLEPERTPDATMTLTEENLVSGTMPYMAPEQLLGENVDHRVDIWGAGVVLYETAVGKRPFDETSGPRLTNAILSRTPEPPSKVSPNVSPGLEKIILKCLDKDPGRRYQSARELRTDLERLLTTGTLPELARSFRASRRTKLVALAAALLILAGALAIRRPWQRRSATPTPIRSLAVLPLDNYTGDPKQDYFSDGMTEALIGELARIHSLKVISRTSVMRFKKTDKTLPEIAKTLGVEGIIEGSVERSGKRVRVTAQLIRATTDEHLWAESFDRQDTDVLSLHSDIARAIANQVQARVRPDEVRSSQAGYKVKPEAYDLVLRALSLSQNAAGPEDAKRAVDLAQSAVAEDPGWARAHAVLAMAITGLPSFGVKTGVEVIPLVKAAADRALAMDENLALAHLARANVLELAYEWQAAGREIERTIELAPNEGQAHGFYGYWLAMMGRCSEAERQTKIGIEHDPLNLAIRCNLMNMLYALRRDQEAAAAADDILQITPHWFWANSNMSAIALLQGRRDESLAQAVKAWQIAWSDFRLPDQMKWEAYIRWIPEELKRRDGKPWRMTGFIAATYALYGETEKAIPYLERAVDESDVWTSQLFWPEFDGLRGDPRFLAQIKRLNLPLEIYGKPYRALASAGR
jgi:serine/threonine protein kinase/tetratricopeptide (TPR) repeat protein